MAWFWRGAQSAFFYYVSCAPCTNYAFERRRAKQKARADKETRELMKHASRYTNGQLVIPDVYGGATQERMTGLGAFTTNIYWREDEMMGPHPRKGRHRRNTIDNLDTGDRKENKKGKGRGKEGARSAGQRKRSATTGSVESAGASSLDTIGIGNYRGNEPTTLGAPLLSIENRDANTRKRYQRPDELLWGDPDVERDWGFYARGRNPSVNSLCPPVVSTRPATSSQAQWMLQPPPAAKVMEGKQAPVTRRLSAGEPGRFSTISRQSMVTDVSEPIHRPEKAHICELGDRMTDLHESAKPTRRSWFRHDGADEDSDVDSRLQTPRSTRRTHDEFDLSVDWHRASRNFSRNRRPSPIVTTRVSAAKPSLGQENSRGDRGFDPSWKFPRKPAALVVERDLLAVNLSEGTSQVDGYHSEPERNFAAGYSFQDFAPSQRVVQDPVVASDIRSHTPRSPNSRPQSDSTASESHSVQSSTSSLQPLDILVTPASQSPLKLGHVAQSLRFAPLNAEVDDVDGEGTKIVTDYWPGGREFRLTSGTAV